ncbi:MAG: helix-turn-helix transcriptional regulator [Burkholderiales bacterium]
MEKFDKQDYMEQFINNSEQIICSQHIIFSELILSILDPNYKILILTQAFKDLLKITENYVGKGIDEFNSRLNIIKDDLEENFNLAIKQKSQVDFIILFDFEEGKLELFLAKCKPIHFPDNELLGLKLVLYRYPLLDRKELLCKLLPNIDRVSIIKLNNYVNRVLTQREEAILFFLINGFTQFEIAKMLKVPRGTVGRLINSTIAKKLGINGTSSKSIIEKSIGLGYHLYLPKAIFSPKVIPLSQTAPEHSKAG